MKATIAVDGSVKLPAAARARLDLEPGTPVRLDLREDTIVIRRATPATRHQRRVQVALDSSLALRRDEAGESYAALAFERRVHE